MLCGEGRAGKTSTRKALLGEPFDPKQPSTCGTQQSLTTVNKTIVSGDWNKYKPEIIGEQHIHAVAKKLAAVAKKEITIEDLQRENVVSADVLEWYKNKINPEIETQLKMQVEDDNTHSQGKDKSDDETAVVDGAANIQDMEQDATITVDDADKTVHVSANSEEEENVSESQTTTTNDGDAMMEDTVRMKGVTHNDFNVAEEDESLTSKIYEEHQEFTTQAQEDTLASTTDENLVPENSDRLETCANFHIHVIDNGVFTWVEMYDLNGY